jgi:hypothetical protein
MTAPQYGINVKGDVLVNATADGIDLNHLWDEFRDLLAIWNQERRPEFEIFVRRPHVLLTVVWVHRRMIPHPHHRAAAFADQRCG